VNAWVRIADWQGAGLPKESLVDATGSRPIAPSTFSSICAVKVPPGVGVPGVVGCVGVRSSPQAAHATNVAATTVLRTIRTIHCHSFRCAEAIKATIRFRACKVGHPHQQGTCRLVTHNLSRVVDRLVVNRPHVVWRANHSLTAKGMEVEASQPRATARPIRPAATARDERVSS
jgi:hypothetical protein